MNAYEILTCVRCMGRIDFGKEMKVEVVLASNNRIGVRQISNYPQDRFTTKRYKY